MRPGRLHQQGYFGRESGGCLQWASRNPAAAAEVTPGSPAARPQPAPGFGSLDPDPVGGLVLGTKAPRICTFWVSGTSISHGRRMDGEAQLPPAQLKLPGGVWGLGPACSNSSTAPCSCPAVNTSPVIQQHLSLPVPQRCRQLFTKCLDAGQTALGTKSPAVASNPSQTVGKRWAAVGIGARHPAFVA